MEARLQAFATRMSDGDGQTWDLDLLRMWQDILDNVQTPSPSLEDKTIAAFNLLVVPSANEEETLFLVLLLYGNVPLVLRFFKEVVGKEVLRKLPLNSKLSAWEALATRYWDSYVDRDTLSSTWQEAMLLLMETGFHVALQQNEQQQQQQQQKEEKKERRRPVLLDSSASLARLDPELWHMIVWEHLDDLPLLQLQQSCGFFWDLINNDNDREQQEELWHQRYLARFGSRSLPCMKASGYPCQEWIGEEEQVRDVLWRCSWRQLFLWRDSSFLLNHQGGLCLRVEDDRDKDLIADLKKATAVPEMFRAGGNIKLRYNCLNPVPLKWQMQMWELRKKHEGGGLSEAQLWKELLMARTWDLGTVSVVNGWPLREGTGVPARFFRVCEHRLKTYPREVDDEEERKLLLTLDADGKEREKETAELSQERDAEVVWFIAGATNFLAVHTRRQTLLRVCSYFVMPCMALNKKTKIQKEFRWGLH
ncbi:hypothetical protein QOT17_015661 [Balamuthia mandrillaris]